MNNLSSSIKKFISNKNTVTILGVLICLVILWVGYRMRINKMVSLTRVPFANQEIQPRTEIDMSMISYMDVPAAFLKGDYLRTSDAIVGKYSNFNTIIARGSLFYTDLVVEKSSLPNSSLLDVEDGYTVINYNVDMNSTYANSMMPNDYINVYFKAVNDDNTVMFGKFLSNVKILDVKDSNGLHVFERSNEARTPAYMLFALPEDMHLLFRKALYLKSESKVELILVPKTQKLSEDGKDVVMVSSEDIKNFINNKTKMVSVDEILSSTADQVTENADAQSNGETANANAGSNAGSNANANANR